MKTDEIFTTGQAEGLTRIPNDTMRRYVRDFRPYFSETAQKKSKGRRYTSKDIQTLLTIRRLFGERVKPSDIEKVLKGEVHHPAQHLYDIEQVTLIAGAAREMQKETKQIAATTRYMVARAEWLVGALDTRIKRLEGLEKRRQLAIRSDDLESTVTKLREEMDVLTQSIRNLPKPKEFWLWPILRRIFGDE